MGMKHHLWLSQNSLLVFVQDLISNRKLEEGQELVIYSDGPSSEFKKKYITGKFLHMISCQIQRPVHWKYFATSHGKGGVEGIGSAAKVC